MEGSLAKGWQLEGHQLRDHLPGGRVVGEEAAVPGGVDAAERRPERGCGRGPREEPPARPSASVPLPPSPADHVAQGHGGQKQAQDEHQLEEEGGAGGSEPPRGRLGVPQEVVLGGKQQRWVS